MSVGVITEIIEAAMREPMKLLKMLEGMHAIREGIEVGWYAHRKYIPASRDLVNYMNGHGDARLSQEFRRLRGRVGGVTRWQVARHEASFRATLQLLDAPDSIVDPLWMYVKPRILKTLSDARAGRISPR